MARGYQYRQNVTDETVWGCLIVFVAIVVVLVTQDVFSTRPQRVKEKSWTYEQNVAEGRPVGEKIGRAVGQFGVDFGRGLRQGIQDGEKK